MLAEITCNPLLGQPSVVQVPASTEDSDIRQNHRVAFDVLLTTGRDPTKSHYEVEIWHNHLARHDGDEWTSTPLEEQRDATSVNANALFDPTVFGAGQTRWYRGFLVGRPADLHGQPRTSTRFTIRFRWRDSDGYTTWHWAQEQNGSEDGVLLYNPPGRRIPETDLSTYLETPQRELMEVTPCRSETPYTLVWRLTASGVPLADKTPGIATRGLGKAVNCNRWFALTWIRTHWLVPQHGRTDLDGGEALLYSFLRNDGLHVVVLAVSGIVADANVQSVLCRDASRQSLNLVSRNDSRQVSKGRAVISVGRSFESALAASVYEARKLVKLLLSPENMDTSTRTLRFEDWLDGLGFCTWNSMDFDMNEAKIIHTLESLKSSGVEISNFIIDDGWQSLDKPEESNFRQGWQSFEADPKKFPEGLAHLVKAIRRKYPTIKNVAVWHALLGYWAGIASDGEIKKNFDTRSVSIAKDAMFSDGKMLVVDGNDVERLYEEFYTFLSEAGITAVKTDVQSAPEEFTLAKDRNDIMGSYNGVWQSAYLRFFGGRAIGCMAQTATKMFNLLAFDYGPELPLRNSDDYFPHTAASHPWHVFCNSHNSVFTSFLNAVPDWDMFQTAHPWAEWHAAARCLSGGPVWITDEPGKFDKDILGKITAIGPRGNTLVLRPRVVGRTPYVYAGFRDETAGLWRVVAYNGFAGAGGSSLLGLFNGMTLPKTEVIRLNEFMGVEPRQEYVVRSYRSRKVTGAICNEVAFAARLNSHDWDILTAHPITLLDTMAGKVKVASLGLVDQMTGNVALTSKSYKVRPHFDQEVTQRVQVTNTLKALGNTAIWINSARVPTGVHETLATLDQKIVPANCVQLSYCKHDADGHQSFIILVDSRRAWSEMGQSNTDRNDVRLDLWVPVGKAPHSLTVR